MSDESGRGSTNALGGLGTVGDLLLVGTVFPIALVGGFFLGRWIGGFAGAPTVGALIGLLLGTVAAFYNLFQTLKRIQGREAPVSGEAREAARSPDQE